MFDQRTKKPIRVNVCYVHRVRGAEEVLSGGYDDAELELLVMAEERPGTNVFEVQREEIIWAHNTLLAPGKSEG